jgi:hypothetical protein
VKFTTTDVKRLYDTLVKKAPEAAIGVVAAFLCLLFVTTSAAFSNIQSILLIVVGAAFGLISIVSFVLSIYFISSGRR